MVFIRAGVYGTGVDREKNMLDKSSQFKINYNVPAFISEKKPVYVFFLLGACLFRADKVSFQASRRVCANSHENSVSFHLWY